MKRSSPLLSLCQVSHIVTDQMSTAIAEPSWVAGGGGTSVFQT